MVHSGPEGRVADRKELPPTGFVRLPTVDVPPPPTPVAPRPAARPERAAAAAPPAPARPAPASNGAPFSGFAVPPVTTEFRRQERSRGRFGLALAIGAVLLLALGALGLLGLLLAL